VSRHVFVHATITIIIQAIIHFFITSAIVVIIHVGCITDPNILLKRTGATDILVYKAITIIVNTIIELLIHRSIVIVVEVSEAIDAAVLPWNCTSYATNILVTQTISIAVHAIIHFFACLTVPVIVPAGRATRTAILGWQAKRWLGNTGVSGMRVPAIRDPIAVEIQGCKLDQFRNPIQQIILRIDRGKNPPTRIASQSLRRDLCSGWCSRGEHRGSPDSIASGRKDGDMDRFSVRLLPDVAAILRACITQRNDHPDTSRLPRIADGEIPEGRSPILSMVGCSFTDQMGHIV
jgi:hypothetical protein